MNVTPLPPRPVADRDTQPFWDGVVQHRLLIPRCRNCDAWIWQPKPLCPACHAGDIEWVPITGNGKIASWTVLYPPVLDVWKDKTPFVVLLVELDDAPGVRLVGQLVDDAGALLQTNGDAEGIAMNAPVKLRWRTDEAGQPLPVWTLT